MWLVTLQEDNKQVFEWMMLRIIYILQYEAYKDVLPITKSISKMHLISFWRLEIILIVTSICKVLWSKIYSIYFLHFPI